MYDLRLYVESQFASPPYAMSAFVALHEKGLTFKLSTIDLGAHENQRPEFAAMSLTRRIPTLVHDGFALSESSAIAEYVNEVFPGPSLYPADSRERAGARQIQAWLARRRWCYYGHPALRPSGQPSAVQNRSRRFCRAFRFYGQARHLSAESARQPHTLPRGH